jgi:hypothetical protein
MTWGIVIFVAAVVAAAAFAWWRGRKGPLYREVHTRSPVELTAQRKEVEDRYTLDPVTTRDVLKALGSALGLDSRRLRLTDRLDALWDMQPDAGFHQRASFEGWLRKRYPNLPDHTYAETISDLIEALQKLPQVR